MNTGIPSDGARRYDVSPDVADALDLLRVAQRLLEREHPAVASLLGYAMEDVTAPEADGGRSAGR